MNFKFTIIALSSLLILSGCDGDKNIVRGPSDPNTVQEEVENPHLVRGIGATKLAEIVKEAKDGFFDISSFKTSWNDTSYKFNGTEVVLEHNYSLGNEGVLFTNSVLHTKYSGDDAAKTAYLGEPITEQYFYINDAFTEIRTRKVLNAVVKDEIIMEYTPVNYERVFYPSLVFTDGLSIDDVKVAGYLNDGRALMQVVVLSETIEVEDETQYKVAESIYSNFIFNTENMLVEYQLSHKLVYTKSDDENVSFTRSNGVYSETFAYEDNGDFDKATLPGVNA